MNTWIVGNAPVGHYTKSYDDGAEGQTQSDHGSNETESEPLLGEKTFFMKGRIMAGQFSLRKSTLGLQGFKWLSKDELETVFEPAYFARLRHILPKQ